MCGEEEESLEHIWCPFVTSIGKFSVLHLDTQFEEQNNFKEWCTMIKEKVTNSKWWDTFWCLAWGVWLRRNSWVFEGKRKPDPDVIHKAVSLVGEYEHALEKIAIHQLVQPPDAAIFGQQKAGLKRVLRDATGDVVMACCLVIEGAFEVDVGEAMAVRKSALFAREAGYSKLVFETDNLKLFHHMKKGITPPTAFGNMVKYIL
ncbi:uncharacterized protein LOC110721323 [Chenopodium quinoa]|uniref:uncharacterized protein LOC110721323 n=1 Tax=Chenopodium quinoa TaxID=63459 RepID=UPI000B771FE6|nr:uncharacterized protein LOC110721323 [Chenopodium quinoa]